jgi:Fe-S-cluster-containing hydrogenase component 2
VVEDRYGPVGDKDAAIVLERRRLKIVLDEPAFRLQVCDHCRRPPRASRSARTFALPRHPNGAVDLLEDRCTGCGKCISACDREAIRRSMRSTSHQVRHVRRRAGGPACIEVCPETHSSSPG